MRSLFRRFGRTSELTPIGERNYLEPCKNIWGGAEICNSDPTWSRYDDVVLMPCKPDVGLRDDPGWGVYERSGKLVDAAALEIGAGFGLVGQSRHLPQVHEVEDKAIAGQDYVYGGSINAHYGHFVCSSLSRLWWLAKSGVGDRKLVFHSPSELAVDIRRDFIGVCLERLGLSMDNCMVVQKPTRFSTMTIPGPAFVEQTLVHAAYRDVCHRIGAPYWDQGGKRWGSLPPAYISKTRLGFGVGRVANEQVIEDAMAARGAEIIYPETLDFPAQVRLFSQRRKIVGVIGSAFHTAIFAPPRSRIVCLCPHGQINSNMILMDKINNTNITYYVPTIGVTSVDGDQGFNDSVIINNVGEVTAEFLSRVFDDINV